MPRAPISFGLVFGEFAPWIAPTERATLSPVALERRSAWIVERMRTRFGFHPDYPFREVVEVAVGGFAAMRSRRSPTSAERRRRLTLIEREVMRCLAGDDRHDALFRLLAAGGAGGLPVLPARLEHVVVRDGARLTTAWSIQFSDEELLLTLAAARSTSAAMPKVRRPPGPNDSSLHALLLEARELWKDGTGTPARHIVDGSGRPTAGSVLFFAFIRRLLRAGGVRLNRYRRERRGTASPKALARTFERLDRRAEK